MKPSIVRRGRTALYVVGAVVLFGASFATWYRYGPRRTPAGQAPLTYLTAGTLDEFRDDFNHSADRTRVLAMLSPT